ncbi:MAG: helix-turn-helix transcriptional regulator [Clostridia bacterium]|nr:helix-turn-helix transcriptional regulator [Clostridia bacterium]
MTFGEKLSKLRKENNYTQEQLADILSVSRQSVSKWESDIAYPETDKLIDLGKLFDCSMDYLLKEEITEKTDVHTSGVVKTVEKLSKKLMTDQNKSKAKKFTKMIGIIFSVFMAADIISLIVYFLVSGIPA